MLKPIISSHNSQEKRYIVQLYLPVMGPSCCTICKYKSSSTYENFKNRRSKGSSAVSLEALEKRVVLIKASLFLKAVRFNKTLIHRWCYKQKCLFSEIWNNSVIYLMAIIRVVGMYVEWYDVAVMLDVERETKYLNKTYNIQVVHGLF